MRDLAATTSTMSSREIAELTGKDHKHVLTDVRNMCESLKIQSAEFSAQYKDSTGRTLPCFNLPKRETLILVSGYNVELRAKIIDRWQELEAQVTITTQPTHTQIPTSRALAITHVEETLHLATLFEVPTHLAQVEAVKSARLTYNIDFSSMLVLAPAQSYIRLEDEALEPTELGYRHGLSPIEMNLWLEEKGYQAKINGEWIPTDKGQPFAVLHQWVKGNKSGYNYKWKKSVLNTLIN